jgi:hypothetical protein
MLLREYHRRRSRAPFALKFPPGLQNQRALLIGLSLLHVLLHFKQPGFSPGQRARIACNCPFWGMF